jgi:phospholipid/cholesterol/gamma-HCH transport system substrate-binding protein
MTDRIKNIAVGLTIMGALALLCVMIVLFAGMPQVLSGGYKVTIAMSSTGGMTDGSEISMEGIPVGRIIGVRFSGADPREGIILTAQFDRKYHIPSGTVAHVTAPLLAGNPSMYLRVDNPVPPGAPKFLPTDGSARMPGVADAGDLIGDMRTAAKSISALAQNINDLLAPAGEVGAGGIGPAGTTQGATSTPATSHQGIRTTLTKLNATLDGLTAIVGSKENQENLSVALKDLREFTANGRDAMEAIKDLAKKAQTTVAETNLTVQAMRGATTRASDRFDVLAAKLIADADDLSLAMKGLNDLLTQISAGQGTTGKLISDPRLYNNLVDVADQMSALMKETREMVQQWKTKGVSINTK